MHLDINEIVNNLRAVNTAQSNQATLRLKAIEANTPKFNELLVSILQHSELQDVVKLTAATYLNMNLIEGIKDESHHEIFRLIASVMLQPKIANLHKRSLERAVIEFISKSKILDTVEEFVVVLKQLLNNQQLDSVFLLMGAFAVSTNTEKNFVRFVRETYQLPAILLSQCVSIESSLFLNQWAKAMVQIMDRLTIENEQQTSLSEDLAYEIANSQAINQIVSQVLKLGCSPAHFITTEQQLLELNMLKHQCCQLQLRMLKCFKDIDVSDAHNPCYVSVNMALPMYFNSLQLLASDVSLVNKYECQDLCMCILKIIRCLLKKESFYEAFFRTVELLLENILIPFLKNTPEDLLLFNQETVEFVNLYEDMFEKQNEEYPKTQAAAVLQTLADYIHGFLSNIVGLCLNTLRFHFGMISNPTFKILLSKDEVLTILTILSCQISCRQDILYEIRQLLANSKAILASSNELFLARLYTFMSYNFIQLYEEELQMGQAYLISAIQIHSHPTVEHTALEFIYNQVEKFGTVDMLNMLASRIQTSSQGMLWDILNLFVTLKIKFLSEPVLVGIVDQLYKRVERDFIRQVNKEIDNSLLLVRSLNIVKEVVKCKNYLVDKPFLSEKIWSITRMLCYLDKMEFEDDILQIVNGVIQQKQVLSSTEYELLPHLKNILIKYKYSLNFLFSTINLYILFGQFDREDEVLLSILQICVQALQPKTQKLHNEDIGEALLLLQILVFKTQRVLSQQNTHKIAQLIKHVILKNESKIVQIRGIVLLVLLYPSVNTSDVFVAISQLNNSFMDYDRTVLTIGACTAIMNSTDPATVSQLLNLLVEVLHKEIDNKNGKQHLDLMKKTSKKRKKQIDPDLSFKKSVDSLKSPWKRLDKFSHFRETLANMKKSNEGAYNALISLLSHETTEKLRQVLGCSNVDNTVRKILRVRKDVFKEVVQNNEDTEECMDEEEKDDEEEENKTVRKRRKEQEKEKEKLKNKKKKKT